MSKYLSLIFLYNRASYKKILLLIGAIPLGFLAVFLLQIGNPHEAGSYMLMERAFGGIWCVLLFIGVSLLGLVVVINALNGKKALQATHATTGYTIRRLRLSPITSFLTVFVYYLLVLLIFWGVAVASLYVIGKAGLSMAGAVDVDMRLALGMLRTDIGHALLPVANPNLFIFDLAFVLAMAGECSKSCYLGWHNGRPSAGVILVLVLAFLMWSNLLEDTYMFIAILVIICFACLSIGDVIAREKRPKGDPFKANQYAGIMDLDDFDFDESGCAPEANAPAQVYDPVELEKMFPQLYAGTTEGRRQKWSRKLNLGRLRRRYMPLGINMESANALFGAGILIGMAQHFVFFFRYRMIQEEIKVSIKGVTIASGVKMPYFWDLEAHTYYGYLIAILLVFFLQAYWNYEYYNKKTKSVYVMKRLPDRREYARTIWVAPALQAVFIAVLAVVHTLIDLAWYMTVTPEIAFYPDYLSHLLPF